MNPPRIPIFALLFFLPLLAWPQPAVQERYQSALDAISRTVKDICSTAPLNNKENKVELNAEARATVAGLLKKLTDLGVSGAAKYSSSESEAGLLRTDIVAALKDQNTCRLEIFRTLEAKLLATPIASEALARPPSTGTVSSALTTRSDLPLGKATVPSKTAPSAVGEWQPQPVMESVDFLREKTVLTDRSLTLLANLAKKFSAFADARITLIPQYQTQLEFDQDRLAERDLSMRVRRQVAVRNALVASGFPSDNIFMEQGQASISNSGIRMDGKGRQIEQGIMIQAWP